MKNDLKFRIVTAGTKETSLHIGDVDCTIELQNHQNNRYFLKMRCALDNKFRKACFEILGGIDDDARICPTAYITANSWGYACDAAREKIIECLEAYSVLVMDEYDTIVQFADEFNGVVN